MLIPLPVLLSLITAMIGALILSVSFHRMGYYRMITGTIFGAAAGAVGPLVFMLPLQYCTFLSERSDTIDMAFGVFLVLIGTGITLALTHWIARLGMLSATPKRLTYQRTQGIFRGWMLPLLFLAPTLLILAVFLYYPAFDNLRLSTLLARLGNPRTVFVCVDNFTSLIVDQDYRNSFLTTFAISFSIVALSMTISLAIALVAYLPIRGAYIYRTLLIWPYAISPAVAGIIFLLMFNPTGGVINHFMDTLFGISPGWTRDHTLAPWLIVLASVWKSLGYNILFFIAGLQNVPKDLLEAAAIDGANGWQRFINVTLPLISPITFFLLITNLTYAFFDTFGTIDYLTPGGGPLASTNTLMYNIYLVGIQNGDIGRGAAQSIVLFILVIGLTIFQFRTSGQRVTYGA